MGFIVAFVTLWACAHLEVASTRNCLLPRGYGFRSCYPNMGITTGTIEQIYARDVEECMRLCVDNPECESINFQQKPTKTGFRDCQLFSHRQTCDSLPRISGYKHYSMMERHRVCHSNAPVKGAIFEGNTSYFLFFEHAVQKFSLDRQAMYPIDCPVILDNFFFNWPGPAETFFGSDAIFAGDPIYVVRNKLVRPYLTPTGSRAIPIAFPPWPKSITEFFGSGVPDDVRAVFANGNRFYVCTKDALYTSEYRTNGTVNISVSPGYKSPEFAWSDVTAAAMDVMNTNARVVTLFTGNSYFLFDTVNHNVVGRGSVCSDL